MYSVSVGIMMIVIVRGIEIAKEIETEIAIVSRVMWNVNVNASDVRNEANRHIELPGTKELKVRIQNVITCSQI